MADNIRIRNFSLFEKGFFEKHHSLFDIYINNDQDYLEKTFLEAKECLTGYEETIMWPVIKGPGFCGATNPGAGKSFNSIMTSSHKPLYNSDCLYINPRLNIFAVSDPPGATKLSRKLFQELDARLNSEPIDNLKEIINDLSCGIGINQHATLALIHFSKTGFSEQYNTAFAFIAGDTCVYHGNLYDSKIVNLSGSQQFWGTSHHYMEPQIIDIKVGDFFIIASDGINALKQILPGKKIEDILWKFVIKDSDGFALNVTTACNAIFKMELNQKFITLLSGNDDITSLLVFPENLISIDCQEGYILGGYNMKAF